MSDNNALVSRQASPSSAPVAMQARTDALMVRAKMIANSGYMVPKDYRNNPGACLLAVDWSDRYDVAILETLAHVAFIGGKPVIEVVLQKRLAKRSGYSTKIIETTDEQATVACIGPDGQETGRYTYTWKLAQDLGIHWDGKNNRMKDNWAADRAHMLVKRATARALEYYGDEELATVTSDSAVDDLLDDVASNSDSEPIDAEVVADTAEPAPQAGSEPMAPSEDELRALAEQHNVTFTSVLRTAQEMYPDDKLTTMKALAAHPQAAFDLEDWIRQQ